MTVNFWVENERDLALKEKMILKLCKLKGVILHDVSASKVEQNGKQLTEYTVTFLELNKENK